MTDRDQILRILRDTVHHPATDRELAQILRIPREERTSFKRQLNALVTDGVLLKIRGNRFGLAEKMDLVVGRLQSNARGFGFVVPEQRDGDSKDVYIASANLMEAMVDELNRVRGARLRVGIAPPVGWGTAPVIQNAPHSAP